MSPTSSPVSEATAARQEPRLAERDFQRISRFIRGALGIQLPLAKRTMVEARLRKQLRHHDFQNFREYVDHVLDEGCPKQDRQLFLDLITTNKTDFFREPDHFDHLVDVAVPTLHDRYGSGTRRPFRVWTAASSSGEEPYTIAMVLAELKDENPRFDFEILASDISRRILERAHRAVYRAHQIEPVSKERKKRWFLRSRDPQSDEVKVVRELRKKVRFGQLNLMEPPYQAPHGLDAVFCRNVLIYFDRPTQQMVLESLAVHIRPGGYLYVGHSETAQTQCAGIERVAPAVYRRSD